ncbi:MAG: radical SAM family heme chaperone HemW [Muribaculaceae bacterium]|nr:radical SAM family heme chaperone HemW [Muribaculaceae bacterium]
MLYIHIPFCHSKCAYCDFYSSARRPVDADDYIDALITEFKLRYSEISNYPTIYIGGGTPSSLNDIQIERLVKAIGELININELKEFTIEMNPEDVTSDRLRFYKSLGINRVSMGIQSFNDAELKRVGRRHSSEQAFKAVSAIKNSGLIFSCDLIYGLPEQTPESWKDSLNKLLSFEPHHFSAYLLSYEEGTALWRMREKGLITEADEDTVYTYYNILTETVSQHGYDHYEISNFARPDFHAIHNSGYWDGQPYVGLGASAHSFDGKARRYNPSDAAEYVNALKSGKLYVEIEDENEVDHTNDCIITRLRTNQGLSINDIPTRFQSEFKTQATPLVNSGQLTFNPNQNRYYIPEQNWLKADAIMRELLII